MEKARPQVISCKGAVCWGERGEVKVEEIQVDPPQGCEIRVKMLYASICHTDFLFTNLPQAHYPRVLGHEGVGLVESVGEGVSAVTEGDTVMVTYIGECGECDNCLSGESNLCFKYPMCIDGLMLDGTTRMSIRGEALYQMMSCSTWSEYTVVNVNYVVKLDPSMNLAHASFLSCGFSTGYGGAWKEADLGNRTVAVFGLGAVGLGAVAGARRQGASIIIGIDINDAKREIGHAYGMTHFVNPLRLHPHKSISEAVRGLTQGMGVDCSIECTGVDHLANEAITATKVGRGKIIVIGASVNEQVDINMRALLTGGRTLKGSIFGGIKLKSDLPQLIHKCINKEIQLDALLTHEIALADTGRVFDLFKQSDCVKVLINIST